MYSSLQNSILIYCCILYFIAVVFPEAVFSNNDTTQNIPSEKTDTESEIVDVNSLPFYTIKTLNFDGNKHFNQRKLRDLFRWDTSKIYSHNEILEGFERIIAAYQKEGYVFIQISPPLIKYTSANNQHIVINIKVQEGKRLRVGVFSLTGNKLFSNSKILSVLRLKKGQYFSQTSLENSIDRLQILYSEHGHPKVEIEPTITNLIPKTGVIDFNLQIREGVKVKINELKISGLQKTKPNVVLREIPMKTNDEFDQRKIDQSYHRLRNIGFFHSIQPNLLEAGPTEDKINIHPKVTEARTGRLIGVLGYAPPIEGTDAIPQLTGVVEIQEINLLGTGRHANLFWKSGLLKALRIGYKEPWLLGKPITVGMVYSQLKQQNPFNDAESEEKAADISGNLSFGNYFESEVTLGYKQIQFDTIASQLSDSTQQLPTTQNINVSQGTTSIPIERGTKYSITFRLTRDSRDYFLNPTRGRRDSFAVELSSSDFNLRKMWIDIQQYFQTWENQIIALELHGAAAWGTNIPPTELFYLGGINTLRGYDEDWYSGPRTLYGTLEYRFLTGRNSQLFSFVDFGSMTYIDRPSTFDRLRVGYGFGARLESKGGIIQLDYGLAAGESALRGKIHVKLGASF